LCAARKDKERGTEKEKQNKKGKPVGQRGRRKKSVNKTSWADRECGNTKKDKAKGGKRGKQKKNSRKKNQLRREEGIERLDVNLNPES
jgi:hypothetical protein